MKKFISMLSLVAIVASALFVSCAQKKEPTFVPAFPYEKTATYSQNEDTGVWSWSYDSADEYTNTKGVGFQASKINQAFLEYRMTPNADWTLEVVGAGKEYVEAYNQDGYLKAEELTFAHHLSGLKGMNEVGFHVIKTPAVGEEPVEVEISLTMAEETMTILTLVLSPEVPIFPQGKTAKYAYNDELLDWAWSYAAEDVYSATLGLGFQESAINPTYLEYCMTPNADWTLEVAEAGKEYVEAYIQADYTSVDECTFSSVVNGLKGLNKVGFRVIKTPEGLEEPLSVEILLTMADKTQTILTLVLDPGSIL